MTIFQNKMRYWPAYPTNFPISVCACQLGALHLTFSKATGIWTAKETGVFIGENMGLQGKQRAAVWVRFLHQEERLSRYVAGMYHECMNVLLHLLPPPSFRQPAHITLVKGSFCQKGVSSCFLFGRGASAGFLCSISYRLFLALTSCLCPQLRRERLFEAKGDPVPPKRRGEADDGAALCDGIQ